ncbi:transposase [Spiroplasma litorale]|uniref:Transposase n=1 Tax=Spiroplasma litorale TaxID=216942 RepID=A0A0K1W1L1_9MOLU|nr:DDE-type integrase/transposase/recombinase [Spiroplasma litorale]AKX34071.1 transposase [Spiroplasma litorale]
MSNEITIRKLCKIRKLGKSTYYDWIKNKKPKFKHIDYELLSNIEKSFIDSGKTYGSRRLVIDLNNICSHKKIRRYMIFSNFKVNNYKNPKKTTNHIEKVGKYEKLIKTNADLKKFGDVFSVDITEKVINKSRLYTCGFYNIKHKKIYGLITKTSKGISLVVESFLKMVDELGVFKPNSVIHSDNGSEFKSYTYKLMLMNFDLNISMSRVGRSTDNGYIEGFWSVLKREAIIENKKYKSIEEYVYNFNLYSKFYNERRIKL